VSKNNSFETGRNKRSKKAVIFDLDGTLADTDDPKGLHKIHHPSFAQEAEDAKPFEDMVEKVKQAKAKGQDVVILTARSAHYRKLTKEWLHKNDVPYDQLYMRPVDDTQKDKTVKKQILQENILPNFDVKKAYDDKSKNVKMFRKEGIDAKKV
jgi:FMN phosphatase YigB (HAD superfamily)